MLPLIWPMFDKCCILCLILKINLRRNTFVLYLHSFKHVLISNLCTDMTPLMLTGWKEDVWYVL